MTPVPASEIAILEQLLRTDRADEIRAQTIARSKARLARMVERRAAAATP